MTTKQVPVGVASLLQKFKNSQCGMSLISMESGFSLPIPYFFGDQKIISVFIYRSKKDTAGFQLLPPHAILRLNAKTEGLVEFVDFNFKPPFGSRTPPAGVSIGAFPHPQIEKLKPSQYADQRRNYNLLVDQMACNEELGQEFKVLFAMLMEPAYASYYWAIASPTLKAFMAPNNTQDSLQCR